jgi:hypothetical protein
MWIFLAFTIFLLALGMDEERVYFGVSVTSLLILMSVGISAIYYMERRCHFSVVIMLLCVFPVRAALVATHAYTEYDKNVYDEVRRSAKKCVVKAQTYNNESRYVYVTKLNSDRYNFHNRVKAFYYEKEYIQALPDDLYDVVINGTLDSLLVTTDRFIDGMPLYKYLNYWFFPVDEIPNYRLSARYEYPMKNEDMNHRQKIVRYLLSTLDGGSKELEIFCVETLNNKFVVLPEDQNALTILIR